MQRCLWTTKITSCLCKLSLWMCLDVRVAICYFLHGSQFVLCKSTACVQVHSWLYKLTACVLFACAHLCDMPDHSFRLLLIPAHGLCVLCMCTHVRPARPQLSAHTFPRSPFVCCWQMTICVKSTATTFSSDCSRLTFVCCLQ